MNSKYSNTSLSKDLNSLPSTIKKKMYVVHCHGLPAVCEMSMNDGKKIQVPVTDLKIPKTEETVRSLSFDAILKKQKRLTLYAGILTS